MEAAPRYRSKGADDPSEAKAVYSTTVDLPKPGKYLVLAVTKKGGQLQGAGTTIDVARKSAIPNVGQRPPAVSTDTDSQVAGALDKIDTRDPHDDMHKANFKQVVGKKPVALLFATPALCQSRVCGPVTDIEVEMERKYGDRMTFRHGADHHFAANVNPPHHAAGGSRCGFTHSASAVHRAFTTTGHADKQGDHSPPENAMTQPFGSTREKRPASWLLAADIALGERRARALECAIDCLEDDIEKTRRAVAPLLGVAKR